MGDRLGDKFSFQFVKKLLIYLLHKFIVKSGIVLVIKIKFLGKSEIPRMKITEIHIKPILFYTNRNLWHQVFAKLSNQVNNQIWTQVRDQIRNEVGTRFVNQIYTNHNTIRGI